MHKISIFLLVALVGCGSQPEKIEPLKNVVLAPQRETVNVPNETLRDCDPIPRLEDRAYKQGEVPDALNAIVTVAQDCRLRKRDAVDTIKKSFNISK